MDKLTAEVALMVKAAGGVESSGRCAAITLLDHFDLEDEVILVMERPVPCVDLHTYRRRKGGYLEEADAKVLRFKVDEAHTELNFSYFLIVYVELKFTLQVYRKQESHGLRI